MLKKKSINILEKKYLSFLATQEVRGEPFYDKLGQLKNFYLPICEKIYLDYKRKKKIKVIGLTGGQGAGKSTITQIIKLILETKYNLSVVYFSIDDFYKTSSERKKLSKKVHKLFKTRGVPGTHDTGLIKKTFLNLHKKKFKPFNIPSFDKSRDDRFIKAKWQKVYKQPQIIIFEGWCVGAQPQEKKAIKGMYQHSMQKDESCRILRVSLAEGSPLFPEISGSQHRFTVRFLEWSTVESRAIQTADDVPFKISVC